MEEPDHKTLLALLKERDKEVKNLQKKVAKLEERYIQKHRENSDLLSDRESLLNFAKLILEAPLSKGPGTINSEELESAWSAKEEEKQRSIRNFNQITSEELQKLKTELNRAKELVRLRDMELKDFKVLEENYSISNAQVEELRCEFDYLEKEIESLRIENAKLKSNHDEVSKNKTESLIAAMEQRTKDTLEESKAQKMLTESQARINQLETELQACGGQQQIITNLEEALQEQISLKEAMCCKLQAVDEALNSTRAEFMEHRKKAQKLAMEKDLVIEKLKVKVKEAEKNSNENDQIYVLRLRISELEKSQTRESINLEYLKNIVMRFMEYMYAGNLKEAKTLACVIYMVLEFSNEEIEVIRKARQSGYFLKGVRGMFSSTSPGIGVSHNTLHTTQGRKRINFKLEENKDAPES